MSDNFHRVPDQHYTNRCHQSLTITDFTEREGSNFAEYKGGGFGGIPTHIKLEVGKTYDLETVRFSTVTGVWDPETLSYLFRKSDEDLEREHQKFVDHLNAQRQKDYDENHEEWQRRQDALPEDLRTRLEKFHEDAAFKLDGWPYELIVCELAAVMRTGDSDAIQEFSNEQGVSGNQYGFAQALAANQDVPSALTPLGATW